MNIQIDTQHLTPNEALGLISFLEALLPTGEEFPVSPVSQPSAPSPANEEQAIFGVPIPVAAHTLRIVEADPPTPAPTPISEPTKRTRRTRAEIAADEAAAKLAPVKGSLNVSEAGDVELAAPAPSVQAIPADPTTASAVQPAAASGTTQSAIAPPATAPATNKPIDAETLRSLLNGYIARHSMEDAIGQLKAFGCNRVTEALSLEPEKLNQLAEALRG